MKKQTTKQITQKTLIFALTMLAIVGLTSDNFAAPRGILFDYFGTGRSDYLLLNEINGQMRWDILRNPVTNPPQIRSVFWGFPFPDDYAVLGDYDGDGRADIGVWRPGSEQNPQSYFYIQRSSNPNPNAIFGQPWGLPTDTPLQGGDFDADGKDDFTVVREENDNFSHYILPSGGGSVRRIVFGLTSDFLYTAGGKFNGDERDDILIFREASDGRGIIYAGDSITGSLVFTEQWGTAAGYELVLDGFGDYLGDSRADLVHIKGKCGGCPDEGTWWIKETGGSDIRVVKFGFPLPATSIDDYPLFESDFDGDGKVDIGVFRISTSTFYSLDSSNGQLRTQYWDGKSTSPSGVSDLFEYAPEPRGKSIPVGALKARVTVKQSDGTYKTKRASEFYLKK